MKLDCGGFVGIGSKLVQARRAGIGQQQTFSSDKKEHDDGR